PGRDSEAAFRFGTDTLASATIYLGAVYWHLGDLSRARELVDAAVKRAVAIAHDATLANTWTWKAVFEVWSGDSEAVFRAAQAVVELSERLGLPNYQAIGHFYRGWARVRLGDAETGIPELCQGLAEYTGLANKSVTPLLQGFLAEIEVGMGSAEIA